MRILVLGGTGFIAQNLVPHLLNHGHEVVTWGRSAKADVSLQIDDNRLERGRLHGIFDAVIDLIGGPHSGVADHSRAVANARGLQKTLEAYESELRLAQVVHISSLLSVPGSRASEHQIAYVDQKRESRKRVERLQKIPGKCIDIIEIESAYGPFQPTDRLISGLIAAALSGRAFQLRNPDEVRNFIYVGDLVHFITYLLDRDPKNSVTVSLRGPEPIALSELSRVIINEVNSSNGIEGTQASLDAANPNQPFLQVDEHAFMSLTPILTGIRKTIAHQSRHVEWKSYEGE